MHFVFTNTNISNNLYSIKTYKKNDIIFNEGDNVDEIGFIEEGMVSIKTSTYNENEFEINHIGKNSFYGAFLMFSNEQHFLGTAIALRQTKIITFTKDNLLKALEDKTFLLNYLNLISSQTIKIQEKVKILSQGSIKDKIMFLLLNNKKKTGLNTFHFPSKEILSSFLCIPRPSLSRELIKMEQEGLIKNENKEIILKDKK